MLFPSSGYLGGGDDTHAITVSVHAPLIAVAGRSSALVSCRVLDRFFLLSTPQDAPTKGMVAEMPQESFQETTASGTCHQLPHCNPPLPF